MQGDQTLRSFRFRCAAFYYGLKSEVGLAAAKAVALRVSLNIILSSTSCRTRGILQSHIRHADYLNNRDSHIDVWASSRPPLHIVAFTACALCSPFSTLFPGWHTHTSCMSTCSCVFKALPRLTGHFTTPRTPHARQAHTTHTREACRAWLDSAPSSAAASWPLP